MERIVGSMVALVTPMHEDGSVDYGTLRALVDWHIAEGTDCIVAVGTTGESATVNVEEHVEVIRVCVEHAAGRLPIMAGATSYGRQTHRVSHGVVLADDSYSFAFSRRGFSSMARRNCSSALRLSCC